MRSARQIAAAKRNIIKAQAASARARRGKKRSRTTGHTYGKGRKGRKATRRSLYGSRKHGLSPTQYARRRQRANKWKRRGSAAVSAAMLGTAIYPRLSPADKKRVKAYGKTVAAKALSKQKSKRRPMASPSKNLFGSSARVNSPVSKPKAPSHTKVSAGIPSGYSPKQLFAALDKADAWKESQRHKGLIPAGVANEHGRMVRRAYKQFG